MGPGMRQKSILGVGLLPLVLLPATGRGPIGHSRSLPRIPEPRPLLPELYVRMEVLLVILAPLRRLAALLVLDLRVGRRGSGAVSLRWRSSIPRSFGSGG